MVTLRNNNLRVNGTLTKTWMFFKQASKCKWVHLRGMLKGHTISHLLQVFKNTKMVSKVSRQNNVPYQVQHSLVVLIQFKKIIIIMESQKIVLCAYMHFILIYVFMLLFIIIMTCHYKQKMFLTFLENFSKMLQPTVFKMAMAWAKWCLYCDK